MFPYHVIINACHCHYPKDNFITHLCVVQINQNCLLQFHLRHRHLHHNLLYWFCMSVGSQNIIQFLNVNININKSILDNMKIQILF
jgi:hypothetical protein